MSEERKGFIFINENGEYAVCVISSSGFAPTREVITWVKDINRASVFPHEAMTKRKFKALENCQSLKAIEKRLVTIKLWDE